MRIHLYRTASALALAAGLAVWLTGSALAFPPAPSHLICGQVRDEIGDPIAITNATIILETTTGVKLTCPVVPFLGAGLNYRLKIPMDAGLTADAYKATALRNLVPFRIKVMISGVSYLPIQMRGDYSKLGKPAGQTWLDLTLGEDTTGDGIPDAWKWMVLAMSDGLYNDISEIHPNDRFPGNPMTMMQAYIAGTYAWDPSDSFSLLVIGQNAGASVLEFQAIQGRAYSLSASTDFRQWTPVEFRMGGAGANAPLRSAYVATESARVQVEVPPVTGAPPGQLRFFRATVK